MWELLTLLDKFTFVFTSFSSQLRCAISILNCLAPLSFCQNFSEKSQCWINVIGPDLDHCSLAACENQTNLNIDATLYSWSLKSVSLSRTQRHFISWCSLLRSTVVLSTLLRVPWTSDLPFSLSADNLVSDFKEKMSAIIKKLCQLSTNFPLWQCFLLPWLMPLPMVWSIFIIFSSISSFFLLWSLLIDQFSQFKYFS